MDPIRPLRYLAFSSALLLFPVAACGGSSSDDIFNSGGAAGSAGTSTGGGSGGMGQGGATGGTAGTATGGTAGASTGGAAGTPAGGAAGAGGAAVTLDNICQVTTSEVCGAIEPCCNSEGFGFDRAACETQQNSECEASVAAVRAGNLIFDASQIDACLQNLPLIFGVSCDFGFADFARVLKAIKPCDDIFSGMVPEGGSCRVDDECQTSPNRNVFCDEDSATCQGTTVVPLNGPCEVSEDLDTFCDEGLYCAVASLMPPLVGTCQPATPSGMPCDTSAPFNLECGFGFFCDGTTGVCTPGNRGGELCADDIECESFTCTQGRCEPTDVIVDQEDCTGP